MSLDKIKITHPEFGESEILSESLPVWKELGWMTFEVDKPTPRVAHKGIVGDKKTNAKSEVQ